MLMDSLNESKITVQKVELLNKIKSNRDGHRAIFNKAQAAYREQVIRELETRLEDARKGRKIERAIRLVEPEEHTRDYDRVILMLEMSQADTIEISEHQFSQYVMDEWGWSQAFESSTASYAR